MTLVEYIVSFLEQKHIKNVFGYPGASILYLIDTLRTSKLICYQQLMTEQAAAFAADAYARSTGTFGVAIATSGPGATNLLTGIANAYFDSIPCMFFTGQVSQRFLAQGHSRQGSFQHVDIVNMAKPVTKYATLLESADSIVTVLDKAWLAAVSGRPGPVLIDIPYNLQKACICSTNIVTKDLNIQHHVEVGVSTVEEEKIKQVYSLLKQSKRPLILVGGGVAAAKHRPYLRRFAEILNTPVVASLMGLSAFPHDHPLFSGFIGSYGNRYANFSVAASDLLIVLGSRLDERQVGNRPDKFAKYAKIVHVDIACKETNRQIEADWTFNCDAIDFIQAVLSYIGDNKLYHKNWLRKIEKWQRMFPSTKNMTVDNFVAPNFFMSSLGRVIDDNAIVCFDVGQNQMWAAQSLPFSGERKLISSSGHGAMGFALPAAIGAAFACPDRQVICLSGDGGFQMNLQELLIVGMHKLPIKFFLFNNNSLGMIREFQERYFNAQCIGSVDGFSNPDYAKIADAYNIQYFHVVSLDDMDLLPEYLCSDRPSFIEVALSMRAPLEPYPKPNCPLEEQFPELPASVLSNLYKYLSKYKVEMI